MILPTIHTIVSRGTSSVLQGRIGGSAYSLYNGTVEADSLECPVHCLSPPFTLWSYFTVYLKSHIFINYTFYNPKHTPSDSLLYQPHMNTITMPCLCLAIGWLPPHDRIRYRTPALPAPARPRMCDRVTQFSCSSCFCCLS